MAKKKNPEIGTAAVDALRQMRDAGDGPSRSEIGKELRGVLERLKGVHHHSVVVSKCLVEQNADDDYDAAEVIRLSITFPLDRERRLLAKLASRCDGEPVNEDLVDEDDE
jgi:hypothetical protein